MAETLNVEEKPPGLSPLALVTITRPLNGIMASFAVYIASLVAGMPAVPGAAALLAMLVVFLISAGGMAINDYFDAEIDRINRPARPIPSGKITKQAAIVYSGILFAAGIAASYLVNSYALGIAAAASLILILYAWKLKKVMFVGNVSVSALVGLTFIYGGLVNMNVVPVAVLAVLAFLANLSREIYKSIDDIMGDRKHGVASLATRYGVHKARTIAAGLILLAVAFSFLPFGLSMFKNSYVYMFFVLVADMAFLLSIVFHKKAALLIKLGMFVALISFLAGALS